MKLRKRIEKWRLNSIRIKWLQWEKNTKKVRKKSSNKFKILTTQSRREEGLSNQEFYKCEIIPFGKSANTPVLIFASFNARLVQRLHVRNM